MALRMRTTTCTLIFRLVLLVLLPFVVGADNSFANSSRTTTAATTTTTYGNATSSSSTDRQLLTGKPNILFISIDDLNAWVGYFNKYTKRGNSQSKTPNFNRLSKMGMAFTNAHAPSTICNPSRTAVLSGVRPHVSGCYENEDYPWKSYIAEGMGINAHFKKNGYYVAGMGKTYHSSQEGKENKKKMYVNEWNDYPKRIKGKNWEKLSSYAGWYDPVTPSIDHDDEPDWHTTNYCIKRLKQKKNDRGGKPLFLACGLVKPHLPWAVPDQYYKKFPKNEVELPPYPSTNDWKDWDKAIRSDLKDVPSYARDTFSNIEKDYKQVIKKNVWESSIQSYLATINYMDMNIGRILDALEDSPERDNTIVVVWSDHGYHLGEKGAWKKKTLWAETSDVPFVWVVPGLTKRGSVSKRPVDLMSIYPTLCDLAGIKTPDHVDGDNIKSLLKNPSAGWNGVAKVTMKFDNHAVVDGRYRYIRYKNGSEELYDHQKDPWEKTNLAKKSGYGDVKKRLAKHLPDAVMKPWHDGNQNNNVKKSCNNKGDTVKKCSDGSFVARDPNRGCNFVSCP